jgi:dTDP-4-amino-4,6-dideoxygalactose transaminase
MVLLRSHGITRDAGDMENDPHGPWYYEQVTLGFNYRMTEMQAALGLSQMSRLDEFVARRRSLARRYDDKLEGLPLSRPWQHPDSASSWHLYIVRLDLTRNSIDRRAVFEALRARGVGVNLHYMPVYLQPHYRRLGFAPGLCPEAERYYDEAISIPLFATLEEAQQDHVVTSLAEAVKP